MRVLSGATEAAAGLDDSIALDDRGRLWEWAVGDASPLLVKMP